MDNSKNSSTVALWAVAMGVATMVLITVPAFDMYLDVKKFTKTQTVATTKINELEGEVQRLTKLIEQTSKEKENE